MGGFFSIFSSKPKFKIVMLGMASAGKTTALRSLSNPHEDVKQGETVPTIGHNVDQVNFHGLQLNVWDVGGQDRIRKLWEFYLKELDALIFIVDSTDQSEIMDRAGEELQTLVEMPEMQDVPVLILANKQDCKNALSPEEVEKRLLTNVPDFKQKYRCEGAVALNSDGLDVGMDWLKAVLTHKKEPEKKESKRSLEKREEQKKAASESKAKDEKQPATAPVASSGVLTLAAAAQYLMISEEEMSDLLETRKVKGRKLNTGWRVKVQELDTFLGGDEEEAADDNDGNESD